MVVKVKKKEIFMGEEVEFTHYLPDGISITRERREKAEALDRELKGMVSIINREYEKLEDSLKKDELKKWKWLGGKIEQILRTAKNLNRTDIDNQSIWPAIGQYLRSELHRGFDAKRSGTKKDHYRKCWLLATLPAIDWINSWSGWDAFVDRGEQLVISNKVIPMIGRQFSGISPKLKAKDYQIIAKMITAKIPSGTSAPTDIDAMNDREVEKIVSEVYREFKQGR